MSFIPCSAEEYPDMAALLLAMAAEAGHDIYAVQTVTGGFEVPEGLARQLISIPAGLTPPPGWNDPLPETDVEVIDGKVMLTETARARILTEQEAEAVEAAFMSDLTEAMMAPVAPAGREEIRTWAKDNGYDPAPSGKLKQSVMDAFRAANLDRATSE